MSEGRVSEILENMESDWLVEQTEEHLIFGPVSASFRIFPLFTALFALYFIINTVRIKGMDFDLLYALIALIVISAVLHGATTLQQAIIAWAMAKLMTGFVGIGMLVLGPLDLLSGKADWWMFLLLGAIWCPGPEFHPEVAPWQKVITLARLVLTLPVLYLAYTHGLLKGLV